MAGITAFYSNTERDIPLKKLVELTTYSSFPLSNSITQITDVGSPRVAFGGVYPKHFQRKINIASSTFGTLILYGELYNEHGWMNEAEFALNTLRQNGIAGIASLNGPFALFFWNELEQSLLAATDRLGRFPLFYFSVDDCYGITTDLHSVFASGILKPSLRLESVVDFLTIGFPLGEHSMFENVNRVAGGEYLLCS